MSYRFTLLVCLLILAWSYLVIAPRYPAVAARIGPWTVAQDRGQATRIPSAKREAVAGSPGVLQVTLQQSAIDRIGIRSVPVRDIEVLRTRMEWGELMTYSSAPETPAEKLKGTDTGLLIRVPLAGADDAPVSGLRAKVFPLTQPLGQPPNGTAVMAKSMGGAVEGKDGLKVAYYLLEGTGEGMRAGQRMRIELPLAAYNGSRKVVPYSSIVYDPRGGAWVFENSKPLTYVRRPVKVDYIEAGLAILSQGPPAGTDVVFKGTMEVYGAESGVGQ